MQGVEVRNALDIEHADLAVDDELAVADLQRRLRDPWEPPCPIEAAPGKQLDVLAVVVFYLVDPIGAPGTC